MTQPPSPAELRELALTEDEYRRAVELLGRLPNQLELGMLGAMWSEHCSYKTSKRLLRQLPTRGEAVVLGPGENAGVVDLGDSLLCCFKIESHNHPSAIEPVQGAATGVGGILRDVFAMGARPVALLDAIRFGDLDDPRQRHRFSRVVEGIGFYGNCIGVPTVGGETYFDAAYQGNCLVNAMCVGLVTAPRLLHAVARGVGNPVLLVGADTGRDGIHGATFASVQLDEGAEERRPAVQVGNPFLEKCLMEACLELAGSSALLGLQDCGAAGLTSSCAEMARRGGVGIRLDLDNVARRELGMTPYEVMLSESQERMVLVVERGRVEEVRAVFDRWELRSDVVGEVIAPEELQITAEGEMVAQLPLRVLVDGFLPRRPRSSRPPRVERERGAAALTGALPWTLEEAWLRLLDLRLASALHHQHHPLLGLAQHHLVGGHPRLPAPHGGDIDLDPHPTAPSHLRAAAGEPGGATVLQPHQRLMAAELEAGFHQALLQEGVAHLDRGTPLVGCGIQLHRGEGRPVDPVPAGGCPHQHHRVAHSGGHRPDQLGSVNQPHAHRVDQAVARVLLAEVGLPSHRRHPDAVAVEADPLHHPREPVALTGIVEIAESDRVQQRHRAGAHGEHVAQNAPHPGSGALHRLDRAGMVVGLDLEAAEEPLA